MPTFYRLLQDLESYLIESVTISLLLALTSMETELRVTSSSNLLTKLLTKLTTKKELLNTQRWLRSTRPNGLRWRPIFKTKRSHWEMSSKKKRKSKDRKTMKTRKLNVKKKKQRRELNALVRKTNSRPRRELLKLEWKNLDSLATKSSRLENLSTTPLWKSVSSTLKRTTSLPSQKTDPTSKTDLTSTRNTL